MDVAGQVSKNEEQAQAWVKQMMDISTWFKNSCFRVTQTLAFLPQEFRIFRSEGWSRDRPVDLHRVSAALRLQRTKAQHGEPVWMLLTRHQLPGTFANALWHTAAQERSVIQKALQQAQVLTAELPA